MSLFEDNIMLYLRHTAFFSDGESVWISIFEFVKFVVQNSV